MALYESKQAAMEAKRRAEELARQIPAEACWQQTRTKGALEVAAALIIAWKEDNPNVLKLADRAVRITDAILQRIEETE